MMRERVLPLILLSSMIVIEATGNSHVEAAEKQAKERLAVLDLDAKYGIDRGLAEALSVIVRDKLHGFGDYEVMSSGDIQAVASREQMKQALGCTDDGNQCLVDFGRAIGTRFMVAGDISKLGATYTISLRMLDTKGEGAGVKNRVSESCKCDEDTLIGTVQNVAAMLVNKPMATKAKKAEERDTVASTEQKRLPVERQKIKERTTHLPVQKQVAGGKKAATVTAVARTSATMKTAHIEPITGMEFILVPGGCFQMGDTFGDGEANEKPVHEACIDDFYMGKYEVTQGQYRTISGNNPSRFKKGDNYPVEQVSWNDTQRYIQSLNIQGNGGYRLPTETEWEFAARSGGKSEKYAGGNTTDGTTWYANNSEGSTHPVGLKQPNGLGLYDMSGNVWEWCEDWDTDDYYGSSPRNNPKGPSTGRFRADRGGGWSSNPKSVRAANRYGIVPYYIDDNQGFRLVLPIQRP